MSITIYEGKFLYEDGDSYFIRNSKGEINKIEKNKFFDGQIVQTTDKHFSKHAFIMLIDPCYTVTRGWIYGNKYVNIDGGGGGSSFSWDECDFTELSAPDMILYAERFYLNEKINKLKTELKQSEDSLNKIQFALDIIKHQLK